MARETTSLFDQRVYAQATPPQDTRDGIIWVDTSLASKPTKVYSADTQSFVAVGIADYSQLENRIIGTEVDEYIDGTAGQVESKGFQTPTDYASSGTEDNGNTARDSGTLTDGLENFVGYFIFCGIGRCVISRSLEAPRLNLTESSIYVFIYFCTYNTIF